MEGVKVSLCPACDACPEVEVLRDQVRIGEAGNEVKLGEDEWTVLVELIRTEKLTRV